MIRVLIQSKKTGLIGAIYVNSINDIDEQYRLISIL